jgi:shikimate dehydrogenase
MSFAAIAALADNPLSYPEGHLFAGILGTNPSQGARSPALWNAAFKMHGIEARMLPIDVPAGRLDRLLAALEKNQNFMGGAVAMPHKEAVARWLGKRLTPEAHAIGAVNCFYRSADCRLLGTNTDGEGALVSFEARFGPLDGKSVLLMGPGGAGKAVAAFVARAVGPGGHLVICGRSAAGQITAARLSAGWVDWEEIAAVLPDTDVLVNCTSVGAGAQSNQSPLSPEQLAALPGHAVVFDIIYQPSPSVLLTLAHARGLKTLDGTAMNLEQAVLAFGHTAPHPKGSSTTLTAMQEAKKTLG